VQNPVEANAAASLMSTYFLMLKNNYPQSYPRLEDMLVNTNNSALEEPGKPSGSGPQPAPKMKQRPRSEDLGAL
jgi:hypothetical protein